jgi:hypothetical protein
MIRGMAKGKWERFFKANAVFRDYKGTPPKNV